MAVTAPVCNTTVFSPAPQPVTPHGYKLVPSNATLEQVINIVNQNFSPTTQVQVFQQLVFNDISGQTGMPGRPGQAGARGSAGARGQAGQRGQPGKPVDPSVIRQMVRQEIGKVNMQQFAIVRKKVKVTNPEDKEQYVMDDRVVSLVMRDATGARWTFKDPDAEKA